MPLSTLKMTTLAPMPKASVRMAVRAKPGEWRSLRKAKLDIGEDAFGARPHPGFVAGLFDAGDVAELALRGVFGVFAAHTAGHEGFDFFGEVLLDLLGEIAVDLPAGERAVAANS